MDTEELWEKEVFPVTREYLEIHGIKCGHMTYASAVEEMRRHGIEISVNKDSEGFWHGNVWSPDGNRDITESYDWELIMRKCLNTAAGMIEDREHLQDEILEIAREIFPAVIRTYGGDVNEDAGDLAGAAVEMAKTLLRECGRKI